MLGTLASLLISGFCLAEERTVRIYNWIEYLPPDVLKSFREETGIRPIYDVFDSAETMESKLLTGNSGYDVVFPGTANLGHLIKAGAVQPLDRRQLPNWQHLDPQFMQSLEVVGDTGNRYAAPYLWGTTLIGYNVDKVRKALGPDVQMNSWDIIFKEENLAKLASCGVGFLDAGNEILPIALHYKGLDPNSQKREDYPQAQALMMKIQPYVTYFNSSRYGMDLANGDICIGVGWSGGVALATRLTDAAGKGVKVAMALPKEGAPMWSDVMMIPANAPDTAGGPRVHQLHPAPGRDCAHQQPDRLPQPEQGRHRVGGCRHSQQSQHVRAARGPQDPVRPGAGALRGGAHPQPYPGPPSRPTAEQRG